MKKNWITGTVLTLKPFRRMFLIMRLSFVMVLCCLIQVSASTYSQNTKLDINLENGSMKELFKNIKAQSEFTFVYNVDDIEELGSITCEFSESTVEEILDFCLMGTNMTYKVRDKVIVIVPCDKPEIVPEELMEQQPQKKTITGKVTDEKGESIPGVSIVVNGTTIGTISDNDGNYTLEIPDDAEIIEFSFIGMKTQEIEIGNQSTIDVIMEPDVIGLEEVVAIGYGTVKKADLTGAVSQLTSDDLEIENPNDVTDMLRGNVAGLNVGFSTSPKGVSSLEVRGKTTLTAGASPLIVLDGVIYNGDMSDINPNDIERIDVLKDASSAAVFGARASNGVIMITTKKGKGAKPTITFNSSVGLATMSTDQPVYGPDGYVNWRQDVLESTNVGFEPYEYSDPRTLPSDISQEEWMAYDGSSGDPVEVWLRRLSMEPIEIQNYQAGKTVDWYDMTFQNGLRQDHNLALSGKKEELSYYWSVGYNKNEGIRVGDEFTTIRSRLNLDAKINEFISVGINTQFADRDEGAVPIEYRFTANSPWGSEYEDDGVTLRLSPQDDSGTGAIHPKLAMIFTDRQRKISTLNSTIFSKINLPFGITYQVNFVTRFQWYNNFNHNSSKHPSWGSFGGSASRSNSKVYEWQIDNIVKWNKTIADVHNVDVTLLANAEKHQYWSSSMSNKGFDPNDNLGYHNMGAGIQPTISTNDTYRTGDALMARLQYSYNKKYLFTGSVRRDGYSAFGVNNPRATFPSLAGAWVMSEENFMQDIPWLEYFKLRYSWGQNGNRSIGQYVALSDLNTGKYLHQNQSGTIYQVSQLYVNNMANKDLKWERTTANNIGLDFGIFNNRLSGTIEAYLMSTTDLLVRRSLPDILGFSFVYDNLGEVQNKGLEFTLNSTNMKRENFEWNSSFNFSLNRNEIISLYGDMEDVLDENGNVIGQKEKDDISNGWFIGHATDQRWGLKTDGVYTTDEADIASIYGVYPGDFKVIDVDDDGKYTNEDKHFLGYSKPRFRWTLRNQFKIYKNIDFSFMMYSMWGHESSFNAAKNQGFGNRTNSYILPYWTEDNQ
ncbi:MAG: SusC/RagA family TonB-linked outer membrane protein, partial [Flavobacteriales bacterium]|nr:SusC/RagA family TonB-linked outer membrane protein [Flavobacteriales bacterium]